MISDVLLVILYAIYFNSHTYIQFYILVIIFRLELIFQLFFI